jgi:hypothetical protein
MILDVIRRVTMKLIPTTRQITLISISSTQPILRYVNDSLFMKPDQFTLLKRLSNLEEKMANVDGFMK